MHRFVSDFGTSFLKGVGLGLIVLIVGGVSLFSIHYSNKALPGVYVGAVNVSGYTGEEIVSLVDIAYRQYISNNPQITLSHGNNSSNILLKDINLSIDEKSLITSAISVGRSGSWWQRAKTQYGLLFKTPTSLPTPLQYNQQLLADFVSTASAMIDNPVIPASVYMDTVYNAETESFISFNSGSDGEIPLESETVDSVVYALSYLQPLNLPIKTRFSQVKTTRDELETAIKRAKKLSDKTISLQFPGTPPDITRNWQLAGGDLVSFLSVSEKYDLSKINTYIDSVAQSIDRPGQNALFQFDPNTNRVTTFKPGLPGYIVQKDILSLDIRTALDAIENNLSPETITVKTALIEPVIDTADVNSLGIETLLGTGESTYYNSPASRKHNVELASKKLNGILVPPGEKFSFNEHLGEITLTTGFQQALVIRDGRTLPGDGGGVCQDSTTLFRAVLSAGLPITSWQNHSYRVGYYEQNSKPGFDATVYSPLPDFVFLNDTPAHILIQTRAENMKLTYELYGTSDGRQAVISNYSQWDATPPPPDLHQDDPSLPLGVVRQVEKAVPGLKTKFDYTVTRNNEVIFQKTFLSVFRPWQAVYLHGTKQ